MVGSNIHYYHLKESNNWPNYFWYNTRNFKIIISRGVSGLSKKWIEDIEIYVFGSLYNLTFVHCWSIFPPVRILYNYVKLGSIKFYCCFHNNNLSYEQIPQVWIWKDKEIKLPVFFFYHFVCILETFYVYNRSL